MSDKHLITTAKFVSTMFTPLCVPLLAFAILFTFSYLSLLTLGFRLVVLGMVASFTIILPKFAILLYRKMNGWTLRQASKRENRVVPYLLTITCYMFLPDVQFGNATLSERNNNGRTDCSCNLHNHQPLVENKHTHGWHRRTDRRTYSTQHVVRIQHDVVDVLCNNIRRNAGHKPNDSAPALAWTDNRRLLRGIF